MIAEVLGLDRKAVRRYAHAVTPQDLLDRPPGHPGRCVPPYLHQRWNEGCTDTARLFAEICEQGYQRSKRTLRRHFQDLRAAGTPAPKVTDQLTARRATRLLTSHPTVWTNPQRSDLPTLLPAARNWPLSPTAPPRSRR